MEPQSPNAKSPSISNDLENIEKKTSPSSNSSSERMNPEPNDQPNLTPNSSNSIVVVSPISQAPPSQEGPQVADLEEEQDREYGCKYCNKKFTNKQALGGHQNAHKLERAMEKTPREMQGSHFGYFGGPSSYPGLMVAPPPLHGSFNRSHDILNRQVINRPYILHQPLHFSRPLLPMGNDPYPRPVPVLSHTYPGWTAPTPPRFSHFVMPVPTNNYVANRNPTSQFTQMGPLGSSGTRPISEGMQSFVGPRSFAVGLNVGGRNNNDPENQLDEDSGLDLSLRL